MSSEEDNSHTDSGSDSDASSDNDKDLESLNDKLAALNEIPITIPSEIPSQPAAQDTEVQATAPPTKQTMTTVKQTKTTAKKSIKRKTRPARPELNPKYHRLSSERRVRGSGFGAGFLPPRLQKKKNHRMYKARSQNNGQDYLNLQSHLGFAAKGKTKAIEFRPLNKEYVEIASLLMDRAGRPGPGHYTDGLDKMYAFAGNHNPTGKKIVGPRMELDFGSTVKRTPRFNDINWKIQHFLAGSLNREKTKMRLTNNGRHTARGGKGKGKEEEGREEADTPMTGTPKRRVRPSTAGNKRKAHSERKATRHARHIERSKSYAAFSTPTSKRIIPISIGPGFGRPLNTPIRRLKKVSKPSTTAVKEKKKKTIDEAMVPRIKAGSCITPITTLSKKQLELLHRAVRRASGEEPRKKKIGPRGVGAPVSKRMVAVKKGSLVEEENTETKNGKKEEGMKEDRRRKYKVQKEEVPKEEEKREP